MSRQELAGNNNQVSPGYKQTEVGVIPEDWEVKQLGDIVEKILGGGTPSRSNASFWNGDIPWVTVKDFATFNPYLAQEYITKNGLVKSSSNLISKGTLIICTRMNLGKIMSYNVDVAINQDLKALFITPNISNLYLNYFLQCNSTYIENLGSGSTVKGILLKDLRRVPFYYPPLPEQKAIASVLSDVDELISSLDKLIAKKRHIKTATMQQLLTGKTRLPGFGEGMGYQKSAKGMGYQKSAIGLIPEDWEVRELGSLATIQRGASPRPIDSPIWYDSKSTVGWVRISDITNSDGKFLKITQDYLSKQGIAQSRYLPIGSLIMSICATVGIPVMTIMESCIHDGFVGFSNLQDVDQEFLYYKLKELETYFKSKGQTGSQSNLNSDLVRACIIPLPPLPEQKAIASVLSDMDKEIAALEKRRAKTQGIKQGMMQELLTGRTRLINNYNGE
ncbi:MAG: restriction endonuclease subunit S [Arthrospira sp. PLM2.Bin9]|nr:restriction endonuclease subunit S [Arthrospira sp. PLM2.Bin9]TVU53301.1 MAG: restriction endonuclease subunit S [Arthrospira sp. PLM2.Bin9]